MPIRLGDISGRRKKVAIKIDLGDRVETANVWYKPANYTVDLFASFLSTEDTQNLSEEEMMELAEQDSAEFMDATLARAHEQADKVPQVLAKLIDEWDVLDDDGNALPTSYELFASLDLPFLNTLMAAVMQDMQAEQGTEGNAKSTNSKNGSRQKGSMVSARGGTR